MDVPAPDPQRDLWEAETGDVRIARRAKYQALMQKEDKKSIHEQASVLVPNIIIQEDAILHFLALKKGENPEEIARTDKHIEGLRVVRDGEGCQGGGGGEERPQEAFRRLRRWIPPQAEQEKVQVLLAETQVPGQEVPEEVPFEGVQEVVPRGEAVLHVRKRGALRAQLQQTLRKVR